MHPSSLFRETSSCSKWMINRDPQPIDVQITVESSALYRSSVSCSSSSHSSRIIAKERVWRWYEPAWRDKHKEAMFARHNRTFVRMSWQQLWQQAHNLHRLQPDKTSAWKEEVVIILQPEVRSYHRSRAAGRRRYSFLWGCDTWVDDHTPGIALQPSVSR